MREALSAILAAGNTRLVVVSGRWTQDLPPLLGIDPLPEIWGSHGWERLLPDGSYEHAELDAAARQGIAEARAWVRIAGISRSLRVQAGQHRAALARSGAARDRCRCGYSVLAQWQPLAERSGLDPHQFDGGIELRAPGRTKGFAIQTILAEMGPGAFAAYLGDDKTDEDAFVALSGSGLGALVRDELRDPTAQLWLRPPDELLAFLAFWQRAMHDMSCRPRATAAIRDPFDTQALCYAQRKNSSIVQIIGTATGYIIGAATYI